MQGSPYFGSIALGGPGGVAQIEQRDEKACEKVCSHFDEDCKLECLEEDRGEVMRDPDDKGLAQVSNNGGRRDKGKGLAQIGESRRVQVFEDDSDEDDSDVSDVQGQFAQIAGTDLQRIIYKYGGGLAQISRKGNRGRRDEIGSVTGGGGLAQTTGWFWDSEETSEDEKEQHSRDAVADGHDLAQIASNNKDRACQEMCLEHASASNVDACIKQRCARNGGLAQVDRW